MFGMQHTFKRLSGGIAIAAFVAVVAVPSAFSMTFITDTLGGNGSPKAAPDAFERAVAIHTAKQAQQVQGVRFITDTLGGNGYPKTDVFDRAVAIREAHQAMSEARAVAQGYISAVPYVNGGMSPAVAQSNQTGGQVATASSTGSGFNWKLGGGIAAGLLLLLLLGLGSARPRQHRRNARTA